MLVEALKELSEQDGCQILLTTHVPGLAGLLPRDSIRFITRKGEDKARVGSGSEEIYREVAAALGVLPDPAELEGVELLICVEGPNDVHFLNTMSDLLHRHDTSIPNIRNDPRLAIFPLGGSTLKDWVLNDYLGKLKKPQWHLYDRDTDSPPKYEETCSSVNGRNDGSYACLTAKREMENYIHPDAIADIFGIRVSFGDMDDVPMLVAKEVHTAGGGNPWDDVKAEKKKEKEGKAKRRLNIEATARMTIEQLQAADSQNEIQGWLRNIASRLRS